MSESVGQGRISHSARALLVSAAGSSPALPSPPSQMGAVRTTSTAWRDGTSLGLTRPFRPEMMTPAASELRAASRTLARLPCSPALAHPPRSPLLHTQLLMCPLTFFSSIPQLPSPQCLPCQWLRRPDLCSICVHHCARTLHPLSRRLELRPRLRLRSLLQGEQSVTD